MERTLANLIFVTILLSFLSDVSSESEKPNISNRIILSSVRQVANTLKMMRDLMLLGSMGLPFLAMFGLGSLVLMPYFRPLLPPGRLHFSTLRNENYELPSRRALAVQETFDQLKSLEQVFKEYEIHEPECRLRAVCEVHQYTFSGDPMDRIVHLIKMKGNIGVSSMPPTMLLRYREASRSGLAKQDCSKLYGQCTKSVFYFIRNKSDSINLVSTTTTEAQ